MLRQCSILQTDKSSLKVGKNFGSTYFLTAICEVCTALM